MSFQYTKVKMFFMIMVKMFMVMMMVATQQERYTPLASSPGTTCTSRTSHSGARLPEHLDDGDGCCNYDHHKDNGNNHYKFILYERVVEREGGAPTYAEKHSACGVQLLFDINIEFYERKRQTFHK